VKNRSATISEPLRLKIAALGAESLQWLNGLDNLIEELEAEWQLTVGENLVGGSEAYVAPALTATGTKVILKVVMPQVEGNTVLANEVAALKLADGRGYVRLLHADLNRRALVLEQLGTPLGDLGYTSRRQMEIICATLKEAWVSVPPGSGLPDEIEMTAWFSKFIGELWLELAKPCSQALVDKALEFAQNRAAAYDPAKAVLVHGDAHCTNTLQNPVNPATFKLIDPDGIVAEPAYDLGVVMREWQDELLPDPVKLGRERCMYLSELTGVDAQSIWQWGYLQCTATGLLLLRIGQEETGRQMLNIAEAWTNA
jgi:streptomycin 6-kinase